MATTTPFFAAIIGYLYANERITCFEAIAMVISFCGVMMITLQQGGVTEDITTQTETSFFDGSKWSGMIGCLFILGLALGNAIISVQTRLM